MINGPEVKYKKFTLNDKLADFEYLYTALVDNYPYFKLQKRKYNIDWIGNKKKYIERIEKTSNDKEFLKEIITTFKELKDPHLTNLPYSYFRAICNKYSDKKYAPRGDIIKSAEKQYEYLGKVFGYNENQGIEVLEKMPSMGFGTKIFEDINTVYLKIPSFNLDDNERESVLDFLLNNHAENIIVDIRGNSGGDSTDWSEYVLPALLHEDISQEFYGLVKIGDINLSHLKEYDIHNIKDLPIYKLIDSNLIKEFQNYIMLEETVKSFDKRKRYSNIYLLVDNQVYSSSEGLSLFVKASKFATIIGARTKGDYGIDRAGFRLPHSGLCIFMPLAMFLNPDGTINAEVGTTPDIICESEDALETAIKQIKVSKDK